MLILPLAECKKSSPAAVGNKAMKLSELISDGYDVPDGFVISFEAVRLIQDQKKVPELLSDLMKSEISRLEHNSDKEYGISMILSCRSSSQFSMPGILKSVLNVGFTSRSHEYFNNEWDGFGSSERLFSFLHFSSNVLDVRNWNNRVFETDHLKNDDRSYLELRRYFTELTGKEIPDSSYEQLYLAILAVVDSWNSLHAKYYRKINQIPDDAGLAILVQPMIFGNLDQNSGAGVLFSRDPLTGKGEILGDFIHVGRGEEVVSGLGSLRKIEEVDIVRAGLFMELQSLANELERRFAKVQEIEFVVERGRLRVLQSRDAVVTPEATLFSLRDLMNAGDLNRAQVVARIVSMGKWQKPSRSQLSSTGQQPVAAGVPASVGTAVGRICVNSDEIAEVAAKGEPIVLARDYTVPEDVGVMRLCEAVLTVRGGLTSHAVVVARALGKPCIVGITGMEIQPDGTHVKLGERLVPTGTMVSIDADTGFIYIGTLAEYPSDEPEIWSWYSHMTD